MRRKGPALIAIVSLALFASAALGAIGQGQWSGRVIDEPGSRVTFRVTSPTRAINFRATQVAVLCGIFPNSTLETRTVVVPSMRIEGNQIAGTKVYRNGRGEYIGMAAMRGRRIERRIQGTIEYDDASCSGTEKFVARRN